MIFLRYGGDNPITVMFALTERYLKLVSSLLNFFMGSDNSFILLHDDKSVFNP